MILANEFAQVQLELDSSGNGPRLCIRDLKSGHLGYLDPLELEMLAWASKDELAPLLDPAASRWRLAGEEHPGESAPFARGDRR